MGGDGDVGNLGVGCRNVDEAGVQGTRADRFDLIQRDERDELEVDLRMSSPEVAERVGDDSVP